MKKTIVTIAALALSLPVFAQHAGGRAGVGVGAGVGAGMQPGGTHIGGQAGVKADADVRGGNSAANSNAGGELRGLDRAETRMSDEGKAHEKATTAPHGKKKGHSRSAKAETHTEGSVTTR